MQEHPPPAEAPATGLDRRVELPPTVDDLGRVLPSEAMTVREVLGDLAGAGSIEAIAPADLDRYGLTVAERDEFAREFQALREQSEREQLAMLAGLVPVASVGAREFRLPTADELAEGFERLPEVVKRRDGSYRTVGREWTRWQRQRRREQRRARLIAPVRRVARAARPRRRRAAARLQAARAPGSSDGDGAPGAPYDPAAAARRIVAEVWTRPLGDPDGLDLGAGSRAVGGAESGLGDAQAVTS